MKVRRPVDGAAHLVCTLHGLALGWALTGPRPTNAPSRPNSYSQRCTAQRRSRRSCGLSHRHENYAAVRMMVVFVALRRMTNDNAAAFAAYRSDPVRALYQSWETPYQWTTHGRSS